MLFKFCYLIFLLCILSYLIRVLQERMNSMPLWLLVIFVALIFLVGKEFFLVLFLWKW
jgi:hypothetical protein